LNKQTLKKTLYNQNPPPTFDFFFATKAHVFLCASVSWWLKLGGGFWTRIPV